MEKVVDPRLRIVTVVENETQVRREFHIDAVGYLGTERLLVPLQSGKRLLLRLAAERHHGDRRQTKVRRHFHFANRQRTLCKRRLLEMAAHQSLDSGMANKLSDAQQTLRGTGFVIRTRHGKPSFASNRTAPWAEGAWSNGAESH